MPPFGLKFNSGVFEKKLTKSTVDLNSVIFALRGLAETVCAAAVGEFYCFGLTVWEGTTILPAIKLRYLFRNF